MRTLHGRDEMVAAVGEELGVSDWVEITEERVDAFADVTGDRYWIHVDPERAAGTALGGTIAHGLLTLSLGPALTYSIVTFAGFATTLNYGFEKVRFTSPVAVGSRLRMRTKLLEATPTEAGLRAVLLQTFELDGHERPACVAHSVLQLLDP